MEIQNFDTKSVIKYLLQSLNNLHQKMDSQKIMMVYFYIASLDALDKIDTLQLSERQLIVDWIYSLQLDYKTHGEGGFRVFTYSALSILKILKDDLSRVDKQSVLKSLEYLKQENGSFKSVRFFSEQDLRFVYSALVISHYINDFSQIDKEQVLNYILSCQNIYDGGFGLIPGQESHGGAVYCALSSLKLLNSLDKLKNKTKLLNWLVFRQQLIVDDVGGFHGRVNKYPDSCYSFWIGSSLRILGFDHLITGNYLKNFVYECQSQAYGGFQKYPDSTLPDPVHTIHSLYGLYIFGNQDIQPINIVFGIRQDRL